MTSAVLLGLAVGAGADWRRVGMLIAVLVPPPLVAGLCVAVLAVRGRRPAAAGSDVRLLGAISSELRAGRSLRTALVSAFGTDPSDALGRAGRRARLGRPMTEVTDGLDAAFGRHGALVSASLRLVDRRGGSAADALDAAALLVREDRELDRELSAATAPARLSALVVGLAPLALVAWQVGDGALARAMALPGGIAMFGVGAVLVIGGVTLVFRLSRQR